MSLSFPFPRWRFWSKIANFSNPVYFAPPLKGFPWYWVSALGVKKTNDEANRPTKTFDDIFSRLDTIHQRDRQTDRRTDGRTDRGTDRHRATAKTALTHSVAR